jgi:hypothetical protein
VGLATAPGPSNLGVVGAPDPARPNGYHWQRNLVGM